MKLKNGLKYNSILQEFQSETESFKLSKIQAELFEFLVKKKRIVGFKEIQESVWADKKMTRFTLRNMINKIRSKSYKEIITSHSGIGYEFNSEG